jgi:hypothetical protein
MFAIWLGVLLIFIGVLLMARTAITARRLSDPPRSQHGADDTTLEPPRQGLRFLGIGQNWPAAVLFALGAILIVIGAVI